MTFTAIGACPETGRLGIGIATYSLGVGGYCPFFERGVAALSTQAFANPALGPQAVAALRQTSDPERVLVQLAESDTGFDWRQVVIAAADGRIAAHTGPNTRPWSGHITGEGFAVFGNVLAGEATVQAMAAAWRERPGKDLPERLLAAIEAGADRIHGTAMGIGERVGNVEMDLLLVNLALAGVHDADLSLLAEYCDLVVRECEVPLPSNYPVIGPDAFRTATGVHAAAIIKAQAKGADWLADRVYSGVPASLVGRRQVIEVGPMSGISNVRYWLADRGYDPGDTELCERIFNRAKQVDHTLSEDEVVRIVERFQQSVESPR